MYPLIVSAAILIPTVWYFFFASTYKARVRSIERKDAVTKPGELKPRCNPYTDKLVRFPEPDVTTAYEAFEKACKLYGSLPCLGVRPVIKKIVEEKEVDGKKKQFEYPQLGKFSWLTYQQVHERVHNFGSGLLQVGLKPKQFLAIFEETRLEWTLAMRGAFTQSIVVFTVYSNLGEDALLYALKQGEITHIIANGAQLKNIAKIKKLGVPSLTTIIYTDSASDSDIAACQAVGITTYPFQKIEEMGAAAKALPTPPTPDDLACIMYTSGSTGAPKGVMTTHTNVIAMAASVKQVFPLLPSDVFLHYLPLAHSMAFSAETCLLYSGLRLGYGSPRTLTQAGVRNCDPDLKELAPTVFIAVPTIFERIMHGVNAVVKTQSPFKQKVFNYALQQKIASIRAGTRIRHFWDFVAFRPLRKRMGIHKVRIMLTGSAPLSGKVHDWVRAVFNAPLLQGYGLTETNSAGTIQYLDDIENEQIGTPQPAAEWKLVDVPEMNYLTSNNPPCGEIYLRGSTITKGYYKDEQRTKEAYFPDGEFSWFATGDIGTLLPSGALKIVDRKKNLIKPPHGEYIALEKLESYYKNCAWLSFLMVYVDGAHYDCILLGVPNKVLLTAWAKENNVPNSDDWAKLCADQTVRRKILDELSQISRDTKLRSIETIRNVRLLPDEWTPENEMLTAAMKLNRTFIVKKYKNLIDEMYDELERKNKQD